MKIEPTVSSETSAIITQDAGELPKKEHIKILRHLFGIRTGTVLSFKISNFVKMWIMFMNRFHDYI